MNFLRTPVPTRKIQLWILMNLREKLIKVGVEGGRRGSYLTFQMAEVAIPGDLVAAVLKKIERR